MRNVLFCLIVFLTSIVYAQNKSGIVSYRAVINQKYVDSFLTTIKTNKEMPMNIKQGVVDMYQNATPDEYFLNFKNEESYYYYNPPLDREEGYNIGSKAGRNSYYTDNSNNSIIEMNQYLGNIKHNPINWKVTNKTKKIGGYKCYQAIATEELYSRQGFTYCKKVIAWFTPEIPLNFGPKYYNGLPGLILEIDRDKFTLRATKINLNPEKKDLKIKKLNKDDQIITQEEAHNRIKELEEDRKSNN